jgi:hypothetical protein
MNTQNNQSNSYINISQHYFCHDTIKEKKIKH